jgi:hypothetical protein
MKALALADFDSAPTIQELACPAMLTQTADPIACPDVAPLALYEPFPQFSNDEPQSRSGGPGYNSRNGRGQVNASSTVLHAP